MRMRDSTTQLTDVRSQWQRFIASLMMWNRVRSIFASSSRDLPRYSDRVTMSARSASSLDCSPSATAQNSRPAHRPMFLKISRIPSADPFACFHPVTAEWFKAVFDAPTAPQRMGWPVIARGENALILAPTGTGKTLTAFFWCLDRLMLHPAPARTRRKAAASFMFRPSRRSQLTWSATCAHRLPEWPTWPGAWVCRSASPASACAPATRRKRNAPALHVSRTKF